MSAQTQDKDFLNQMHENGVDDPFLNDEILVKDEKGEIVSLTPSPRQATPPEEKTPAPQPAFHEPVKSLDQRDVQPVVAQPVVTDVEKKAKEIIQPLGVTPEQAASLERLVISRLKNIRDKFAFREQLTERLGSQAHYAERIANQTERAFSEIEEGGRKKLIEPTTSLQKEVNQLLEINDIPKMVFQKKIDSVKTKIDPVTPPEDEFRADTPFIEPTIDPEPRITPKRQEKEIDRPIERRRPLSPPVANRPKVEDIKFTPRLTGPLEEIQGMTVQDFRMLGSTKEAAEKIIDKINLLEDESFSKKMDGIKVWKKSPLNQVYLSMIEESIETNRNLHSVAESFRAQGRSYLSDEEIDALAELNRRLRH